MKKINLGCGPYPLSGYINIDKNRKSKADVVRDVRYGLPFDDSSVDEVMASHFLEHLDCEEMLGVMEESFRVLKPDACLEIVVPLMDFTAVDHKQHFVESSFDIFWRDAPEQFDRKFLWVLGGKEVRSKELSVSLKASK